jgi:NitT/TauT family transport system permease protein
MERRSVRSGGEPRRRSPLRTVVVRSPGAIAAARARGARVRRLATWVAPASALTLWWLVTTTGRVERFFVPRPQATFRAGLDMLRSAAFWADLGYSIFRIGVGFLLAAAVAIPCGILMARSRAFNALVEPSISFIRFIPMPAVIPLMILWFGSGEWGKVMIICLGVTFQLVLMVADAVADVPEAYDEIAHSIGVTPWQALMHFTVPAALPAIWDSLRINFGLAWSTLIFAEILGATSGLGYLIVRSQRFLLVEQVFVTALLIGALGILSDKIFEWCYNRWFPWSVQARRDEARS